MEMNGRIKLIVDTQTYESGFSKREFVITTNEQYPQEIKFELIKEKTNLLDQFDAGDEVNVQFNIRGREYQGKYYVNLQAWKLDKISADADAGTDEGFIIPDEGGDDGLPF